MRKNRIKRINDLTAQKGCAMAFHICSVIKKEKISSPHFNME